MAGVDLSTVGAMLGHKDIRMTQRYAHLAKGHIANGFNRLGDMLLTDKQRRLSVIEGRSRKNHGTRRHTKGKKWRQRTSSNRLP